MASLNLCQFIGNLGRDPEVKYSPSGDAICNFSIAINESWFDKATGTRKENTEWVRVVAYRKLGEICGEYLKKGSSVWIMGKIKTRKWTGQDGKDNYTTEIIADSMQMLGGRDGGGADVESDYARAPAQQQRTDSAPQPVQRPQAANPYQAAQDGLADMDDDITF